MVIGHEVGGREVGGHEVGDGKMGWTRCRQTPTGWTRGRQPFSLLFVSVFYSHGRSVGIVSRYFTAGRRARFPPEAWHQTDRVDTGLGRTNNFCEPFNKTFSEVVGHSNPTVYNFLSAVQVELASTEGKIASYR